jgi:hypothetical protein
MKNELSAKMWVQWLPWSIAESEECKMKKAVKNQPSIIGILVVILALAAVPIQAKVNYEIWENSSNDVMPDFSTLGQPTKSGTTDIFNFDALVLPGDAQENFVVRFTGYIKIATAGDYTFYTSSDDGSMLYIGDWKGSGPLTTVVNNDGLHGTQEASGTIHLDADRYGIMVTFFEKGGGDVLDVSYAGPGITKKIIPAEVLVNVASPIWKIQPYDQQVNVLTDATLQWQDPSADQQPVGMLYNVYFGTDPNIPLMPKVISAQKVNSYAPTMAFNTQYYWRVDILEPNLAVFAQGDIFTFKTAPKGPVILTQPAGQLIPAGQTATFTLDVLSAAGAPLSYAWFKPSDPGTILGTGQTFEIPNAQIADETFYACRVTNDFGTVTSNTVSLYIKRLVGYWPFDGNLTDTVAGNNGAGSAGFAGGIIGGGQAINFVSGSSPITVPTTAHTNTPWTISVWDKSDAAKAGAQWESIVCASDGLGTSGYEIFEFDRLDKYRYVLGFNIGGGYYYTPFSYDYPRDIWHLNTIVFNSETALTTWYIDGEVFAEFAGVQFTRFAGLYVGNSKDLTQPFIGLVDDLRLYNYPLSADEVAALYLAGKPGETICRGSIPYDLNNDCKVDIGDLALLVDAWLQCQLYPVCVE